ncbi:unnamed protein product, partial [Strongylus vulgaris]
MNYAYPPGVVPGAVGSVPEPPKVDYSAYATGAFAGIQAQPYGTPVPQMTPSGTAIPS